VAGLGLAEGAAPGEGTDRGQPGQAPAHLAAHSLYLNTTTIRLHFTSQLTYGASRMEADTLFLNFLGSWGRVILNREMKIFSCGTRICFLPVHGNI